MERVRVTSASLLPPRVKFAYGIGSIAYGVKEQGFAYFLLMFYGTVVGLEPALAGTALLIALLTDAISDPIVGYWSDNIHTRWGRRHPFMYASAIPVSLCYFLIWQPPDWSEQALFFYLLALAILIRTLITFFETPSSALMPELTSDYDERTAIQAWRHFFGWFGGASLTILMFAALLVPTAEYEVGTLNRQGYETYGVIAGVAIFIAIVVSSIGTQHAIKLNQPARREPSAERRSKRLTDIFAELKETLFDPSFFALFVSSMAGAVATGLSAGLTFIMMSYFWQLSSLQMFLWTCMVLVAATVGLLVAPRVARRLGKRHAVLCFGGAAFVIQPAPVTLRLLGIFPDNGDPLLFPLLLAFSTVELSLMISMQVVLASMVADLVEHSEIRTGRRSEGVFYAAVTFIKKTNQGVGAFIAGLLLQWVDFPKGANPADVPAAVTADLGSMLVPCQYLLWSIMLIAIYRYRIDRETHVRNLSALQKRG